jgi:hypothetical protein
MRLPHCHKHTPSAGVKCAHTTRSCDHFIKPFIACCDDWPQAFLIDGMESLSQAKVGSALQVFFNLEQLQQVSQCCSRPYSNATRCARQQMRGSSQQ